MNAATRYVETSKTNSPVHAYVADHGRGVSKSDIEQTTVAGRSITLSTDVDTDDQNLIADGIQATNPTEKECFANALRMWKHNSRLKYVEGFAVMSDFDAGGFEHAWCLLDGEHLVDPTTASFDHYYGVVIDDPEILHRYAEECPHEGILGNHKDRYAFLRDRGYVD
jgi:ribosomal protein S27AE